jgi:hypothetical protein
MCRRIWFPLDSTRGVLEEDLVDDHTTYGSFMDFPAVAPGMERNADYRYLYGGTVRRPSPQMNQVCCVDAVH